MKRQQQKAATRAKIKEAFVSLLRKKPLEQITVTEIATMADIDRKTFYLYYDTIRGVYMEIEQDRVHPWFSGFKVSVIVIRRPQMEFRGFGGRHWWLGESCGWSGYSWRSKKVSSWLGDRCG